MGPDLKRTTQRERGQATIEYVLVLGVIIVPVIIPAARALMLALSGAVRAILAQMAAPGA